MDVQRRRAIRPRLVSLEGRELLSGIIALMAANAPRVPSAISALSKLVVQSQASSGTIASGNTGSIGSGNGFVNNSASPLIGNGAVTRREAARESFHGVFNGRVYTAPGRFNDQATTYLFQAIGGTNFFLHGDLSMAVITPTNPTQPFLGEAILNDKSTGSGGILGLVLAGDRTSIDSLGRPTHLTFTSDPNIYSGIFFVSASTGTVDITYGAKNSIHVVFNGRVYTSGLTNPLVNSELYARGGRSLTLHIPKSHH